MVFYGIWYIVYAICSVYVMGSYRHRDFTLSCTHYLSRIIFFYTKKSDCDSVVLLGAGGYRKRKVKCKER